MNWSCFGFIAFGGHIVDRERQIHFEIMKNISRKYDEIKSKNIVHQKTPQWSQALRGAFPGPSRQFYERLVTHLFAFSAHLFWQANDKMMTEFWFMQLSARYLKLCS